jgi:LysM repeat protein
MVDKKKLNRVKRVLSAGNGAELPKYTVKPGDTLSQIILNYNKTNKTNFSLQDVASWNNIADPNKIQAGQILSFTNPQQATTIPGADPSQGDPNAAVDAAAQANAAADAESGAATAVATAQRRMEQLPAVSTEFLNGPTPDEIFRQQARKEMNERASAGMNLRQEELKKEKAWGGVGQVVTGALETVGGALGAAQAATDSNTTKTADALYDTAAGVAENLGPVGKIVGTAMKFAGMAGDAIQAMGGGTDQQTKMDQWMDSSFFSWNIGMLNGFAGKNTDSFGIDQDTIAQVGSSYGGTTSDINDAASKAGKKYGLFSSKARKKANEAIATAKSQQNLMGSIADNATDQRLAVQSMGEQAGLAYSLMTDGGYNQKYTYAAKQGGMLEWNPVETLEWEPQIELNWELPVFKEGGNIDIVEELEWIPELNEGEQYPKEYLQFKASLPDNQKNTPESEYDTYLGWKLYGKPKDFNEAKKIGMYAWDSSDNSWHGNTIAWDETTGIGYFLKPKHHSTISYELDWFNKGIVTEEGGKQREMTPEERKEWETFRSNYTLVDDGDFYKYVPKNKKGGSLGDSDIPEIEETSQKNVIPEGALHKNKHHMEHAEGLTKKGIPVIDDEGEQQAEIEHSEIIFTLEVTKKLEEYYKIFYSDESSNKEKEQAAIDAGKLLVYQILENTEDRTGLIESCKKGGSLTLKTTTDDLIEEALEWMPTVVIVEEKEPEEKPKKKEEKSDKELMKEAIKEVLIELLTK